VHKVLTPGDASPLTIRAAQPADKDRLLDIWLRSVRATHRFLAESDIQSLLPAVRDVALEQLELWALCEAGEVVGFMGLADTGVEALFIDPACSRRGGGRRLVGHARRLKGSPLSVEVNEQNPEALAFWRACGFVVTGRSPVDSGGRPYPLLHLREAAGNVDDRVSLREITAETVRAVLRLSVADGQKGFVATNAISLAQALFAPQAWYRAIYCDQDPVGFVMLEDDSPRTPAPPEPEVGVWRFMVDHRYQGRGIGRAAMRCVIDHVRSRRRFESLQVSCVPGPDGPEGFYLGLGFRPTGRVEENEIVLELPL
jgi:diamine N-acetyltransferase